MSMLAEKRKKQKLFLNPRGKYWSEDSNKFGQKMLEKMGWSKGKGLGVNEDGIVEHVKLSLKTDKKGVGFKTNNDNICEHNGNFNNLLESLKTTLSTTSLPDIKDYSNSLENKSKNSRVRVHYHKFTRGKDLSQWSEKDLANILYKKDMNVEEKPNENEKSEINHFDLVNDSRFLNKGSMQDYFKNKILDSDIQSISPLDCKRKSGEKKRKYEEFDNPNFIDNPDEETEKSTTTMECYEVVRKKKKKSIKIEPINNNFCFTDVNVSENNKKETTTDNDEEIIQKKKKKSMKIVPIINPCFSDLNSIDNEEIISDCITNDYEVRRKKNKKSKEKLSSLDNPCFDDFDDNDESNLDNDNNKFEVKRNKKKNVQNHEQQNIKEYVSLSVDNFCINGINQNIYEENNNKFEVKRKKKKNSQIKESDDNLKNISITNPTFLDESSTITENYNKNDNNNNNNNKYEVKRKKKKVNKEKLSIDNPCFTTSDNNETNELSKDNDLCNNLILNVTTTPIIKKKSCEKIERKLRKSVRFSNKNQEHIIPNRNNGDFSQKIEKIEAQIENDMNEIKLKTISQINQSTINTNDNNILLPDGNILLKYKNVQFRKQPTWVKKNDQQVIYPKKSYLHIIKDDVILAFNNANLHLIDGYGSNDCNKKNN